MAFHSRRISRDHLNFWPFAQRRNTIAAYNASNIYLLFTKHIEFCFCVIYNAITQSVIFLLVYFDVPLLKSYLVQNLSHAWTRFAEALRMSTKVNLYAMRRCIIKSPLFWSLKKMKPLSGVVFSDVAYIKLYLRWMWL